MRFICSWESIFNQGSVDEVVERTMTIHPIKTQRTRQSELPLAVTIPLASVRVWFAYIGTQVQSNCHYQGPINESHDTGSDRQKVKPVSGVLRCYSPPSGLVVFLY